MGGVGPGGRAAAAAPRWLLAAAVLLPLLLSGCEDTQFSAGTLVQALLIGLILGSAYALIALGYTLVYGVIKLINFAHSDVYMVGAFVGYYALRFFLRWLNYTHGVSPVVCFALSVIVSAMFCAGLAMTMERFAYRPLRKSSRIAALITAVGVSFLLENLGIIVFGANPKSYEPKTLAVYQLQLADDTDFTEVQQYELQETAQYSFPASRLNATHYARARVVGKYGISGWSPVLEFDQVKESGYIELKSGATVSSRTGELGGAIPQTAPNNGGKLPRLSTLQALSMEQKTTVGTPPHSIGYTTRMQGSQKLVTVSWEEAQAADAALNPIFSRPDGTALAFELPVKTADGSPVRVPYFNVIIVGVTLVTLILLNLLITRSVFGISMRALSFDLNAAKLMGVNTDAVIAWTFAIGGACAALAGNMIGLYNQTIEPLMGILPGLKAFIAAVVGGIGSIPGAAAGGLIMGVSEALVKSFIPEQYSKLSDALAFAILIVVLLVRPSGIFGRSVKEKV